MTLTALLYARKSPAETDEQVGVDSQVDLCTAEAERRGMPIAGVFTDVAKSAYEAQYRPDYERLLAEIQARPVGTCAVIIRHNDRLHRDVAEYKAFEKLARKNKVQVIPVLGGDWTVETAAGRFSGTMLAAVAEYESALRTERVNISVRKRVEAGLPDNTRFRAFGFEDDCITHRPEEVKQIRTGVADLLAGRTSISALAREWGKTNKGVKGILLNPRLIAHREYPSGSGALHPAIWEPIIDRDTFDTLKAVLEGRSAPLAPRKWLLSGIARCGAEGCGAVLKVGYGGRITRAQPQRKASYRCPDGMHVTRLAEKVEHYVTQVILEAISELGERPVVEGDDGATLAEIRKVEERLAELERRISGEVASPMPLEALEAVYATAQRRLAVLRDEVSQPVLPPALPGEWPWGAVMEEWEDWWHAEGRTLAEKRAVIESQVSAVLIMPTHKGRLPFRREDVQLVPR